MEEGYTKYVLNIWNMVHDFNKPRGYRKDRVSHYTPQYYYKYKKITEVERSSSSISFLLDRYNVIYNVISIGNKCRLIFLL